MPTSTTISGTSLEPNGTVITVFKNGTALSPTITVTNNTWTLTGVSGLVLGDAITARASTSDNSKNNSDLSNTVFVSQAVIPSCYTPPPVITAGNNGSRQLTISWSLPSGYTITSTSVIINVYLLEGTGANPIYTFIGLNPTTYYPTSGTLTYSLGGNGNITGQYVAAALLFFSCYFILVVSSRAALNDFAFFCSFILVVSSSTALNVYRDWETDRKSVV